MFLKTLPLILVLLALGSDNKIIRLFAKKQCDCYSAVAHLTKVTLKEQGKIPVQNQRVFGGTKIYFNFDSCLNSSLSKKDHAYIKSLDSTQLATFNLAVNKILYKDCPEAKRFLSKQQ